jgi:mono/diheme cytochrome c family protein
MTIQWIAVTLLIMAIAVPNVSRQSSMAGDTRIEAPATGRELFRTYCASCHGVSGRGDGPAAVALRVPPVDLRYYAMNNGGVFPETQLRRIVDGRDVRAHGTTEMPVWGDAFKSSREGLSEVSAQARIAAIVQFVASLQVRPAE